jgi:hypothetical protein
VMVGPQSANNALGNANSESTDNDPFGDFSCRCN